MTENKEVVVQITDLESLKRHYKKAVEDNKDRFTMNLKCGKEGVFDTVYAKYLIEYMENLTKYRAE